MAPWLILVVLVALLESIISSQPFSFELSEDYPLAKSLGLFSRNRLARTLGDRALSVEIMKIYQEMAKTSAESFEYGHRSDVDDDELDLMREESVSLQNRRRRRRISSKLQSAAGLRHARSRALRRDKLHNQSVKSHAHHSMQSNLDYVND